jgi:hypothetical protein
MPEGIFTHDLLEAENIITRPVEFGLRLDQDAAFINIIHGNTQPSVLICRQGKVISLAMAAGISRLLHCSPDPDIIEIVSVSMPDDNINIVACAGIPDGKNDLWPETAFPLLVRQGNVFFKNVQGGHAGRKEEDKKTNNGEPISFQCVFFTKVNNWILRTAVFLTGE